MKLHRIGWGWRTPFESRHEKTNIMHIRSAPLFSLHGEYNSSSLCIRNFRPLAISCICTAWFVSDQVGNQNVGFLVMWLILIVSCVPVSTSNLPLPLASGIETHKNEGEYERGRPLIRGGNGGLPVDYVA